MPWFSWVLESAIYAALATGLYKSFDEAVNNVVKQKDEIVPNEDNLKIYIKINLGSKSLLFFYNLFISVIFL